MLLLSSVFFGCFFFFQNKLFQKKFQEHYQSVNGLDPDQDLLSVGPDMGPNCLQRLSTDVKSPLARKKLKLIKYSKTCVKQPL